MDRRRGARSIAAGDLMEPGTIAVHPQLAAGRQLVAGHSFVVIALFLRPDQIAAHATRGPALADWSAPQFSRRRGSPVAREIDVGINPRTIGASKLRRIVGRASC